MASTALVINDMINSNLRTGNEAHDKTIEASGIIDNTGQLVDIIRAKGIPIVWIRVERRADRADVATPLTDRFIAGGMKPGTPTTRGSYQAENVSELPVLDVDHVVLKPRRNPFIGTDLDLRLRSMGVDTILLSGYSTTGGVESAARTAHDLNYNVVVLSDCCFHVKKELHDWAISRILPIHSRVMASAEVVRLLS